MVLQSLSHKQNACFLSYPHPCWAWMGLSFKASILLSLKSKLLWAPKHGPGGVVCTAAAYLILFVTFQIMWRGF